MIKQNIIFVQNKAGSLHEVTKVLADANIDIYGFSCFDAPEFAVFRMVCDQPEKADEILNQNGYMSSLTDVIVVDLKDEVGSLDSLLATVAECNINMNYVYTSFHKTSQIPVVILKSEELMVTESILKNNGFHVLGKADEIN